MADPDPDPDLVESRNEMVAKLAKTIVLDNSEPLAPEFVDSVITHLERERTELLAWKSVVESSLTGVERLLTEWRKKRSTGTSS